MIEKRNIQDEYLEKFKNEGKELTVFLTNGSNYAVQLLILTNM